MGESLVSCAVIRLQLIIHRRLRLGDDQESCMVLKISLQFVLFCLFLVVIDRRYGTMVIGLKRIDVTCHS